jgi:large subunit ribosomal protein L27
MADIAAGTKWFPGENVGMGKDHTIYSLVPGYVRYYRDPLKHSKRRFIGVALERDGPKSQLPTPRNAPSRRRLGMYAAPIRGVPETEDFLKSHMSEGSILSGEEASEILVDREVTVRPSAPRTRRERRAAAIIRNAPPAPIMRAEGFRETNYSIGQRDKTGGRQLKDFDRSDRWTAWHKRSKKIKEKALVRASRLVKKTKGKKVNKAAGARGAKRVK